MLSNRKLESFVVLLYVAGFLTMFMAALLERAAMNAHLAWVGAAVVFTGVFLDAICQRFYDWRS